jgi:glutathione-regulated potassium-efflux system protein KefB
MSSAAIPLPMLQERGESGTLQGRAVISIDMFQGFMVVPVLALIPILGAGSASSSGHLFDTQKTLYVVGALAGVFVLGRFVLPQVLALTARGLGPGGFVPIALSAVFFAGWWMEEVGISMALGAFMIGVLLSTTVYVEEVKAAVTPARRILLAVFFIAIGMAIDPRQLLELKTDLLIYLPALLSIKFVVLFLLARLFRFPLRAAILTGLLMMPFDEIGFVILASANANGLLDARDYTLGLSVISLSFVISPMLINLGYKLSERLKDRQPEGTEQALAPTEPESVVVAGYAYVGRTICAMLEQAGIRYTAFEVDPDWLAIANKLNHNVRYGDLGSAELMSAIAINRARLVIATNGALPSTRHMIEHLRQFYPSVPVIVAVPYLVQRDEIRHTVGTEVFALAPEGALSFGRRILDRLGVRPSQTEHIVDLLKVDDYAALRTAKGEGPDAAETTSALAK